MIKPKKLTYKSLKTRGGGVRLKGFGEEEYKTPPALVAVADKYGFRHDECREWFDCIEPQGMLDESVAAVASCVSVTLRSVKEKKRVTYLCNFEGCNEVSANNPDLAIYKAHVAWNKAGRPVGGVLFVTAMDAALKKVNEER